MKSKGQALAAALLLSGGCNEHPTHAEQSPDHRMSTVLAQDFGYSFYSAKDLPANSVIDGQRAIWRLSHANRHPVRIYSAGKGLELRGGTIVGEISQTLDWREVYDLGNSAAIRVRQAPQAKISGWRIDKAWDGVRLEDGSDGWLVQDVHISNNRDDAIENDKLLSGTLRDSLIDGTYSGISMDATVDRDGSMNTVVLDRVMMRLKPYLVEGRLTHGGPIKGDDDATSYHPKLRFIDCV